MPSPLFKNKSYVNYRSCTTVTRSTSYRVLVLSSPNQIFVFAWNLWTRAPSTLSTKELEQLTLMSSVWWLIQYWKVWCISMMFTELFIEVRVRVVCGCSLWCNHPFLFFNELAFEIKISNRLIYCVTHKDRSSWVTLECQENSSIPWRTHLWGHRYIWVYVSQLF